MFTVQEVIDIAKGSFLWNLGVDAKKDSTVILYINLGVAELYRRFNLSTKVETIITNPDLALYELKSDNVSLLLGIYNSKGRELRQTDVLGGTHDYKMINYRSFLLRDPKDEVLFAVYKASPIKLTNSSDVIELPDSMIDALVTYVAYMGHGTVNKDNILESSAYAKRFDQACNELENQGYRVSLNTESIPLQFRGYV